VLALSLAVLLAAAPAQPAAPLAADAGPHALQFQPALDLSLTGAALGLWLSSELLKPQLHPERCRWCDRGPNGEDALNGFDRLGYDHLVWRDNVKAAGRLSDIIAYGVIPLSALGAMSAMAVGTGHPGNMPGDVLIVAQATALSALANQTVKFIAGRQRPYAYRAVDHPEVEFVHSHDDNMSFYSGHANLAFALVTSLGTMAELREYPYRGFIWAVGLPLAASVAYLRMGADKHYLSDVLVGAALGSAFGVAIPLLLHPRQEQRLDPAGRMQMSMSPAGVTFSGVF